MVNQQLSITGEYEFHITYMNMFTTTKIICRNRNMITNAGLNFLARKWLNDDGTITKIIVGDNTEENHPDYTIEKFKNSKVFPVAVHVEENRLVLSQNNIQGSDINQTTEIGVIANIDIDEKEILVSRNKHTRINIPNSCILNLKYYYILETTTE